MTTPSKPEASLREPHPVSSPSKAVDVLAVMKEAAEDVVSGDVGLRLLRAAELVAELIAADKEYDDAQFGLARARYNGATLGAWVKGCAKADVRRAAALAALQANCGEAAAGHACPECGGSGAEMTTHDYTRRFFGHDFVIHQVIDGGKQLRASGWGEGIEQGDFLILPNEGRTTRYRVAGIEYRDDPRDMWAADLSFAPRQEQAP